MPYEGPAVFLAPYGNDDAQENFERTVLEGVSEDAVARHSDSYSGDGPVHVWGTKETVGSWKSVEEGDFLFFYRDGVYDRIARVQGTELNEALGRELWPNHEAGAPWSQIIYLEAPVETDVDSSEIHDLAGYGRDYPLGFSSLNEMGIGGIRGRYGSVEELVYGEGEAPDATVDVVAEPRVSVPESVLEELYFADDQETAILEQVNAALNAGKHVVFTGPPGTGKTEIARLLCEHLVGSHDDVYEGFQITTATADWSTFETVGGYMPGEEAAEELAFEPGQVLRRFKRDGVQHNELLVIDEINRADIDKSFGQLFTVLSGQPVQLPYKRDGEEIAIEPAGNVDGPPTPNQYVVPNSWRIMATMNSYDKTSLYELSYAFMRRFAFVHVPAPEIPDDEAERVDLVESFADVWDVDLEAETLRDVGELWWAINALEDGRKIGPAIVKDVLEHLASHDVDRRVALTHAVSNYVFPQLEGVPNRKRIVENIARTEGVDRDRLSRLAGDVLGVRVDG